MRWTAFKLIEFFTFFSGCESETDTEEFEKVGQSPIDRRKMVTFLVPTSIEMATSTEAIEMTTTETLTDVRISMNEIAFEFEYFN